MQVKTLNTVVPSYKTCLTRPDPLKTDHPLLQSRGSVYYLHVCCILPA
jgi:hypothetical protein